ncbi:MAG: TolC family protein [Bacteroidetes bacterium]|nr:TolC family protein [Bacteroidota bacterium]
MKRIIDIQRFIRLVMVGFFFIPFISQAQERPVDPYLVMAAENNPNLKALFHEYLAALEEVPQVGALPDPQVSFGYFILPVETRVGQQRATVSLSQMFPWFGTLVAQEQVAAEQAKVRLQAFETAKLALFKDIKATYNELYYINAATSITEENLRLLQSLKEIATVYYESGRAGFSAVLQVELEEEELKNRLQYLQESRAPLVTRFEKQLNVDLQEPVNLPDTLWEERIQESREQLFAAIRTQNPRLEQLRHEIEVQQNQIAVAKKMGMPSFTLGASYTNVSPREGVEMPDNGQDVLIFPQVGVRLPLYRKKYKAMEKEAVLQREAVQYRRENVENELQTELEQLYTDYLDAQRRVALYQKQASLAQQSLSLLQTEFSTGQGAFEEILRMERQLLGYRLELVSARTALNNYVYSINYLMGK